MAAPDEHRDRSRVQLLYLQPLFRLQAIERTHGQIEFSAQQKNPDLLHRVGNDLDSHAGILAREVGQRISQQYVECRGSRADAQLAAFEVPNRLAARLQFVELGEHSPGAFQEPFAVGSKPDTARTALE